MFVHHRSSSNPLKLTGFMSSGPPICLRNGVLPESDSSLSAFLHAQIQAGVRDDEQSRLMFEIRSVTFCGCSFGTFHVKSRVHLIIALMFSILLRRGLKAVSSESTTCVPRISVRDTDKTFSENFFKRPAGDSWRISRLDNLGLRVIVYALGIMMAVALVPVGGVATAVTTISSSKRSNSVRRLSGFGHCRIRCEMERVVAETPTRTSGVNGEPGRWRENQDQHHSSLNVDDETRTRANPAVEDDAEVLVECRNVYKSFGEKHILQGASFQIRHGEAVGIIGPSGTGKSTILRIIAGLLAPDRGEVYICGKKQEGLASDNDLSGLRIGLVFQSAALFDSLTVRENVGFMLYEHSKLSDAEIAELVRESLAAVGLKNVEERLPSELSGGMKKRVALARAIISDGTPGHSEEELVMYDEPTAGLDPIASTVVEDLIRSVHVKGRDAQGKPGCISSYVVVTHQHSTIRRAVDRILFLYEGKVVWEGPTAEFDTSTNPIVRQFADGSLLGPIRY